MISTMVQFLIPLKMMALGLKRLELVKMVAWLMLAAMAALPLLSWAGPGELDRSFGSENTGFVDYPLFESFTNNVPVAIALDANRRIVIAGTCEYFFAIVCVGRQLANGARDTTFGTQGRAYGFYDIGGFSLAQTQTLATYADGRVVVGGYCGGVSCFFRFRENGQIDSGFRISTPSTRPYGPFVRAMMVDGTKLVVLSRCGSASESGTGCVYRYLDDGSLDGAPFDLVPTGLQINPSDAIARDGIGRYLVAGRCAVTGEVPLDVCIVRLRPDGSFDSSFGLTGVVRITPALPLVSNLPLSLAVDQRGRTLISSTCRKGVPDASAQDVFCLWRVNADGSIDLSFNSAGAVAASANQQARNRSVAVTVTSEGQIAVAGTCVDVVPSGIDSGVVEVNASAQYCFIALSDNGQFSSRFFGGAGQSAFQLTGSNNRHLSGGAIGMIDDGVGGLVVGGIGYPGVGYFTSSLQAVTMRLFAAQSRFDVDDDNLIDAATDGILVLRYLLGIRGTALVAGAVGIGAARITGDQVTAYFGAVDRAHPNCPLDIVGSPTGASATLDGMVLLRAMLGITGDAVTAGINFPPGTARATWTAIRNHLVDNCGMRLP